MKKSISSLVLVALFLALATTATAAMPIQDETAILDKDLEWDAAPHDLQGLQVERGNGFVNFVLPRSPDNSTPWTLHAFVTFTDAEVKGVDWDDWSFNVLEVNGDDGLVGGGPPY